MVASNHLNNEIPEILPTDSAQQALDMMEEFKVAHLPVVFKGQYLGIISETTLLNSYDTFGPISGFQLEHINTYLSPSSYIFDVTQAIVQHQLSIIPIINSQEEFEGVVTLKTLIEAYGNLSSVKSPGSIIEVLLKVTDYSLAEISRIIEVNGSRILSSFIRNYEDDPARIILSLKLDKEQTGAVVATLERHQYNIVAKYLFDTDFDQDAERLQHLFKYLNT